MMADAPPTRHVVVDGSNLATEGRTSPSLAQLDEAVRAYAEEDPGAQIVVVVDATFEHRIDPKERAQFEQAELHGELVSPPAGAVGRGDAFVLRIAQRTGATVLSNDSFQEFHGEHPWLFDQGRLVGGKPVPGVGWIFTPRIPVRGPKSRQATAKVKGKGKAARSAQMAPPEKAAELAAAARKVARASRLATVNGDGRPPQVGDVWSPASAPAAAAKKKAAKVTAADPEAEPSDDVAVETLLPGPPKKAGKKAGKGAAAKQAAKETKKAAATKKAAKDTGTAEAAPAKKAAKPAKKAKAATKKAAEEPTAPTKKASRSTGAAKKAAKETKAATAAAKNAAKETAAPAGAAPGKKAGAAKKAAGAAKKAAKPTTKAAKATKKAAAVSEEPSTTKAAKKRAAKAAPPEGEGTPAELATAPTKRAARRRRSESAGPASADADVRQAIDEATAEVLTPAPALSEEEGSADGKGGKKRAKRRRRTSPPPAVNEPLPFISFVAEHPLGSAVEGEVASFTSHGAMIEVQLADGSSVHCYVPLAGLGTPAPTRARDVLARGERRSFVLVALDPPRRVAELALPGVDVAS